MSETFDKNNEENNEENLEDFAKEAAAEFDAEESGESNIKTAPFTPPQEGDKTLLPPLTVQSVAYQPPTWEFEEKSYPLYEFDKPQVITLPNGSRHHFRIWDETTELKREDFLKSIVITSSAIINGENPRDVKTDFTRSALYYYDQMIEGISGVGFNADDDPNRVYPAQELTGDNLPNGKEARWLDYLSVGVRKAASVRLYSGKIEVEKPDAEDDTEDDGTDAFDMFEDEDDLDIRKEIERQEKKKSVHILSLDRVIVIRQEIGIEINAKGQASPPTNIIRYHFGEPNGSHFSKWELKGSRGFSVPLPKNKGDKAERYYNLDTMQKLFDALIIKIEGAGLNGSDIVLPSDPKRRAAILQAVPLLIKKLTIATLFQEVNNLGNS